MPNWTAQITLITTNFIAHKWEKLIRGPGMLTLTLIFPQIQICFTHTQTIFTSWKLCYTCTNFIYKFKTLHMHNFFLQVQNLVTHVKNVFTSVLNFFTHAKKRFTSSKRLLHMYTFIFFRQKCSFLHCWKKVPLSTWMSPSFLEFLSKGLCPTSNVWKYQTAQM